MVFVESLMLFSITFEKAQKGRPMQDNLTNLESIIRFKPTSSIRFIAEELRRYGIKTNKTNDRGKTLFYQSAHIIQTFDQPSENGVMYPSYALVSFKDLFKMIGKNDEGVDDQDIVRVWVIASKLEKRRMLEITGTNNTVLDSQESPVLPDVYANLHHIHRSDSERENYDYRSKFATNKSYKTVDGQTLYGVSDFFVLG
jgi:hypothetical protein